MMAWLKIMMMTRHHRDWHERAFWYAIVGKRFKTFLSHTWLGRNFDFTALFVVSIPVLALLFFTLPSDITAYKIIEKHTLLIGALLGFPILIKRVDETQKQTRTSQETLKETQKQSRTSQYRDARDLLISEDLNLRMMGIADLWRFANTHPQEEYHNVMDVFTLFIKHPIPYEWEQGTKEKDQKAGKRKDIHAILQHMGERRMVGAESYEIDLIGARLEEAYLERSYLGRADLRDAHLEGANLNEAHLKETDFMGTHLEGAGLSYAHLEGVCFYEAHLKGANLSGAYLEGADLVTAHLEEADLSNAHLEGADLYRANLKGANFWLAHLERSRLQRSNLEGADLRNAHLEGADLKETNLSFAIINAADFADAIDLTQEQIDECVFITKYDSVNYLTIFDFLEEPPILPEGMEYTYREMAQSEWEEKRKTRIRP